MQLIITEEDFSRSVAEEARDQSKLGQPVSSGPRSDTGLKKAVMAALPNVLASRLQAVWNAIEGSVVMAAFDLPPAAAGRTYQLWGIATDLDPVSFGTFQTEPDGTAIFRNPVPTGIEYELGAVTEEPAGGSPQPTSTPFLVGDLSTGL